MNARKDGFLAESSRQPMVDFSNPLADQYPITAKDCVPAALWIVSIVAAVVGALNLPGVL